MCRRTLEVRRGRLERRGETEERKTAAEVMGQDGAGASGTVRGRGESQGLEREGLGQ